jgi:N-acetylneuraminate epimerase
MRAGGSSRMTYRRSSRSVTKVLINSGVNSNVLVTILTQFLVDVFGLHRILSFVLLFPSIAHVSSMQLSSCINRLALASGIMITLTTGLNAQDYFKSVKLPPLPDAEGFAGPFVGTHNNLLIVAGGANFPDKMPWEGGTKVWYDKLFILDSPKGAWQLAGILPRPLGYGVSISTDDGIFCIGGSDANQHFKDCFRIQWHDGKIVTFELPSLPVPCANACGALLDKTIYVAGGTDFPTATSTLKKFWSLDLNNSKAQWQELQPWPGPARMLATAAVQDNSFYLCSGVDLKAGSDGKPVREYLKDAFRYQPGVGWKKIADLPRPAVAAPTPAPAFGKAIFLIVGGDDGTRVDFKPLEKHPGFPKSVLAYDTATDSWSSAGEVPVAHVTTTVVRWHDQFVMPSGEIRPGKRSPAVWSFQEVKK